VDFNVAIIGAGLIGRKRAIAINNSHNCQIKAISDINEEKAKDLAREFGGEIQTDWQKVIIRDDINVVIVATLNRFLKPISIAALKNGKHVLCEKPLGRNAKESINILQTANNSGVILKAGFNHRHHPAILKARQLVENSKIGDPYYIRCIYGHGGRPGYEKEWRADRNLCGGGELLDQGVHIVDLFRWFLGEFEEVFGQINTYYWNMEVEDNAFAIFKTKKGQIAMMHTSWTQWKNKFIFEVFGEKGYIIVDGMGGSYGVERLIIGRRKVEAVDPLSKNESSFKYAGGSPDEKVIEFPGPDISWQEEWKEFVSAIKENREPLGSGYDGLMANRMIEAVYKSAKLNKPVKISQD
jgi:predicted dehydrogenase